MVRPAGWLARGGDMASLGTSSATTKNVSAPHELGQMLSTAYDFSRLELTVKLSTYL